MPRGGKRNPVGGRPPKTQLYPEVFALETEFLRRNLPKYLDTLDMLAQGAYKYINPQETPDKEGKRKIYTAHPDLKALIYLVDRGLYRSTTLETEQLGLARADAVREEIKAQLAGKKALLMQRQSENLETVTRQTQLTVVPPEIVEELIIGVVQASLEFWSKIPAEELRLPDEEWQTWRHRFGTYIDRQQEEHLARLYAEAIPAHFEESAPDEGEGA